MNLFTIGGKSILNLSERDLTGLGDDQILDGLSGDKAEIKLLDTKGFTVNGLVRLVELAKNISSRGFKVEIIAAGPLADFLQAYRPAGGSITFQETSND